VLGFSLSVQAAGAYAGYQLGPLSGTTGILMTALIGVVMPLLIFLFEFIARSAFQALGSAFYYLEANRVASFFFHKALSLNPQNLALKKLYGMTLYKAGKGAEARTILFPLYQAGDSSETLLEALAQLCRESREWLRLADILQSQLAVRGEARARKIIDELINVYRDAGQNDKAISIMEQYIPLDNISALLKLHKLYLEKGDRKAIELCDRIAAIDRHPYTHSQMCYRETRMRFPDEMPLLEKLADLAVKVNNTEEAAEYLEEIVRQEPDRSDLRHRLMKHYREHSRFDRLQTHLFYLVEKGEVGADLLFEYGDLLQQNEDYARAVEYSRGAKERYPDDYRFPYQLASAQYHLKDYDQARQEMDRALELAPQERRAALNILNAKINGAILNRELEEIKAKIEQNPNDIDLRFQLIEKLTANAYVEKAASELDTLLYFNPALKEKVMSQLTDLIKTYDRTFLLLNYLADLHLKDGHYDKVLDLYSIMAKQSMHPNEVMQEGCRKILRLEPNFLSALKTMGRLAKERADTAAMLEYYEQCMKVNESQSQDLYEDLFEAHYASGDFQRAEYFGLKVIQRDPRNAANLKKLGTLYKNNKQYAKAVECLKQARDLDPQDRETYELIKDAEVQVKRDRIVELTNLLDKNPTNSDYHLEIADLYFFFGDYNRAILHYQKACLGPLRSNVAKAKLSLALAKRRMYDLAEETLGEITLRLESEDDIALMKQLFYAIAEIFEEENLREKALKFYKQVFKIDAGYRDVVEKIERLSV
jgi:tetratricopeptide (TPR) repeat protein